MKGDRKIMEINLKEGEVVPVTSDMMFKAILMDRKNT